MKHNLKTILQHMKEATTPFNYHITYMEKFIEELQQLLNIYETTPYSENPEIAGGIIGKINLLKEILEENQHDTERR